MTAPDIRTELASRGMGWVIDLIPSLVRMARLEMGTNDVALAFAVEDDGEVRSYWNTRAGMHASLVEHQAHAVKAAEILGEKPTAIEHVPALFYVGDSLFSSVFEVRFGAAGTPNATKGVLN